MRCSARPCAGLPFLSVTERDETLLEMAERHVAESKERIARQNALIEEMVRDNHPDVAARGRRVLATKKRRFA